MTPTLSVIVPTAGRLSLRRTIESVADQVQPGDEVLVVGDVLDGPLHQTEAICRQFPFVRYLEHAGAGHDWGHSQINFGLGHARGDWLVGNDDDDTFTPTALAAIRRTIAQLPSPRPLLFRFRARWGQLIWAAVGDLRQGRIGGHCLVTPRIPGLIGRFGPAYEGDHDMITSTLALWEADGIAPAWCGDIITVQGGA